MLLDTPYAFSDSYADACAYDESEWRMRARRGTDTPESTSLVAITTSERWVGAMGCFVDVRSPVLVGVYVHPDFRGRAAGVTDALLAGICHWAARHGDVLRLSVHEANSRALAAYSGRGFSPTGRTYPYALDPTRREIEMSRPLHT